jgi:peptidoglycan/LPS O-acetylase OafA/YrhL
MRKRVVEFDVMRALAIFFIIFHHLPGHTFNFYSLHFKGLRLDLSSLYLLNSHFGLSLFVFISGYFLSMPNPSFKSWSDMWHFILKRYVRIYPLYVIALLLFVAINGSIWDSSRIRDGLTVASFVLNLLGLQVVLASRFCVPMLTLWFVGLIVSYYYSFVILARAGRGVIRFVIVALAIPLFGALLMHWAGLMDERFLLYWGIFIAGILAARYQLLEKMKPRHAVLLALIFVIVVSLYVAFIYPKEIPPVRPSLLSSVGLSSFILLNSIMLSFVPLVFAIARGIVRSGRCALLQRIGYASFCIYLFHRPVWWLMADIYSPANAKTKVLYLALLGIPVSIFLSYYLQRFYDRNFGKKSAESPAL